MEMRAALFWCVHNMGIFVINDKLFLSPFYSRHLSRSWNSAVCVRGAQIGLLHSVFSKVPELNLLESDILEISGRVCLFVCFFQPIEFHNLPFSSLLKYILFFLKK